MAFKDNKGNEYEILETGNDYALLRALDDEALQPYVVAYLLDEMNGGWERANYYDNFETAKAAFDGETDDPDGPY